MKKAPIASGLYLIIFCLLSLATTSNVNGSPSPEFESTVAQLRKIRVLHADFLQQKNLKILARPFVARGKLSFSKNDGDLYWELVEPLKIAYLINDKGIKTIGTQEAQTGKAVEFPFADNIGKMFAAILSGNMDALRSYFDISYTGKQADWVIHLKPGNWQVGKVIDNIEISGKEYITRIMIQEVGGDTTEIRFSNVVAETADGSQNETPK